MYSFLLCFLWKNDVMCNDQLAVSYICLCSFPLNYSIVSFSLYCSYYFSFLEKRVVQEKLVRLTKAYLL